MSYIYGVNCLTIINPLFIIFSLCFNLSSDVNITCWAFNVSYTFKEPSMLTKPDISIILLDEDLIKLTSYKLLHLKEPEPDIEFLHISNEYNGSDNKKTIYNYSFINRGNDVRNP